MDQEPQSNLPAKPTSTPTTSPKHSRTILAVSAKGKLLEQINEMATFWGVSKSDVIRRGLQELYRGTYLDERERLQAIELRIKREERRGEKTTTPDTGPKISKADAMDHHRATLLAFDNYQLIEHLAELGYFPTSKGHEAGHEYLEPDSQAFTIHEIVTLEDDKRFYRQRMIDGDGNETYSRVVMTLDELMADLKRKKLLGSPQAMELLQVWKGAF